MKFQGDPPQPPLLTSDPLRPPLTRGENNRPICGVARAALTSLLLILLLLGVAGCGKGRKLPLLPGESELEPHKLLLFLHGYISNSEVQDEFVDVFTRYGVPRGPIDPEAPWAPEDGEVGPSHRYHGHSFDFSRFTRAGNDHNTSAEALAEAFADFYHSLPASCPICRRWVGEEVEVSLVAHSFGGIIAREFIMKEADRKHLLIADVPGLTSSNANWRIARLVTMGTPFFGSVKTRFTRGFQALVVNGVVRTLVMGFVKPEAGGTFGNVVDAQARALRIGSPYLWEAHHRWRALEKRMAAQGENPPRWLAVASVGDRRPELEGDGVTRFASANIAPQFTNYPIETLVVNVDHKSLVRLRRKGRLKREQQVLIRAIDRFIRKGTLAREAPSREALAIGGVSASQDPPPGQPPSRGEETNSAQWLRSPSGGIGKETHPRSPSPGRSGVRGEDSAPTHDFVLPYGVIDYAGKSFLIPGFEPSSRAEIEANGGHLRQVIYLRKVSSDPIATEDLRQTLKKLDQIANFQAGDVWLRFYEGVPGKAGPAGPRVIALRSPLSHFQNGVEPSRDWADLVAVSEKNADGEEIPTVQFMARMRSHLISIPDMRPAGNYRMYLRLSPNVRIAPELVEVRIEGQPPQRAATGEEYGIPLRIRPDQANLVHVYLDGEGLRRTYPKLDRIVLSEVSLVPEPAR